MHKSIIEMGPPPPGPTAGAHNAVMDTLPEDTDDFYVLTRRPAMEEIVVTEKYLHQVHLDGSITPKPARRE